MTTTIYRMHDKEALINDRYFDRFEALDDDYTPTYMETTTPPPDGMAYPIWDGVKLAWLDNSVAALNEQTKAAQDKATKLEAENAAQAEQLKAAQEQTGTLFDQLNGMAAFVAMHTELLTDAQVVALQGFLPHWNAELGTLKVGQVVLDPDEGKPYRVLVEHKTEQAKIPGHDDTDFKLVTDGTEATE